MTKRKIRLNDIILYLIVYCTILFNAGFFFVERYSRYTSIFLLFLLLAYFMLMKMKISFKSMIVFLVILVSIILCNLFNGISEYNVLLLLFVNLLISLLLISCIDFKTLLDIYSNILLIITLFSLVGWFLLKLNISIYRYLPSLTNSNGVKGYFAFFTVIVDGAALGAQRIQGIFWEPGAFQGFLIIAMIIEGLKKFSKKVLFKELLFSIAVIMTYSTTGLIALIVFWIFFISTKFKRHKYAKFIVLPLLFLLILYIYNVVSLSVSGYAEFAFFKKIQMVFDYQEGVRSAASVRVDSIIYPIKISFQNLKYLIFGYGENGIIEMYMIVNHRMFVCTPINYLLRYGLLLAIISICGFITLIKSINIGPFDKIILATLLLIIFSSENVVLNPIIIYFLLYKMCVEVRNNENCVDKQWKFWKYWHNNVQYCGNSK